jgi:hypothetical protein
MTPEEEEEIIELLRRIAELVVMGEKAASHAQSRADEKRASMSVESSGDEDEEDQAEIDSYIALFENFFERNALDLIVKMVTGASFQEDPSSLSRKSSSSALASNAEEAKDPDEGQ